MLVSYQKDLDYQGFLVRPKFVIDFSLNKNKGGLLYVIEGGSKWAVFLAIFKMICVFILATFLTNLEDILDNVWIDFWTASYEFEVTIKIDCVNS